MGRRKIEIKPIKDDRNRSVTFLKRKGGLFKKAHELSVLCSVDVAVVIFGHNKKLYEYSSSDINEIVGRFQYYGGAHEHKGPADFADKTGGGEDDEDDEGVADEGGDERGTPAPEHPMMHPQMQNHPGFQHVQHGTPHNSPPMPNGAMPQFVRGPSPLPPGMSRPSSRTSQHQGHLRRTSSNLAPQHMQQQMQGPQHMQQQAHGLAPQPSYAYTPNPPFYNPQVAPQMQQRPAQQGHQATYPRPYPGQPPTQVQMQQAYLQQEEANRRASMPPAFPPQPPPQAIMQRHPSSDHLQPPQPRPHPSPQPQQGPPRHTPSPQPPQQEFLSPHIPQPRALPAHAKAQSIFTPIDDSRSMLAQHWGSTSNAQAPRIDPAIKLEVGGLRAQSVEVAAIQRATQNTSRNANGTSPRPPPARPMKSPQPPQRTASASSMHSGAGPSRANTNQPDPKRPRLKVQIPSEQSADEGGGGSAPDESSTGGPATATQQQQQPSHRGILPPPSPSAGGLLSAGAQGPLNPFARPAPPMSTNPHAMNRDVNHIETPISALPSRFMSDNLLPSPSSFYPEWGFGRSGDSNMLPSPLNFQTPIVPNGQGWREEDRKRQYEEDNGGGGDPKRTKT
ncbi:hypothetical protein LTR08_006553 [Meristemomyces frigidus]|nr:hypothetical protein LTR08_006553 [Meristemomyces frigidus]